MAKRKQHTQLVTINKTNRTYLLLGILITLGLTQCKSVQLSQQESNHPMEIYLCIGQSNMAGRAPIREMDKDSLENVFLWTGQPNKLWEKAANPLNKYSTVRKKISMQKLSIAYSFAQKMSKNKPNQPIGLVVNAKGGTSIEKWETNGFLYSQALEQTKKAIASGGVLKGIIWHQGESNSSNFSHYTKDISELVAALRKDLNKPKLPFVLGQLSLDKAKRKSFNQMLNSLPQLIEYTALVTSENTSTIDSTHFDSKSQRILGERYAQKILELQQANSK